MKKEYCTYCGSKMVQMPPIPANKFGNYGMYPDDLYDKETGKKRYYNYVKCPNDKWWKILRMREWHTRKHAIGEVILK